MLNNWRGYRTLKKFIEKHCSCPFCQELPHRKNFKCPACLDTGRDYPKRGSAREAVLKRRVLKFFKRAHIKKGIDWLK